MRSFLAVELPEPLRREIGARVERLRDDAPTVRWTRPEALHLTLVFLGERPLEDFGLLAPRWEAAIAVLEPFEVAVGRTGAFPPRGRCRTLWLGLEPTAPVVALHAALARETAAVLGPGSVDPRPFHPHVTVGRCRSPWPRRRLADLESAFESLTGSPEARVPVGWVTWFESELRPDGARYRALRRWALAGSGSASGDEPREHRG